MAETDSESDNYKLTISSKGDALYETSSVGTGGIAWYSDYSYMPKVDNPWFRRGGNYNHSTVSGPFYFTISSGGALNYSGFRAVLTVGEGL
ncbi:MAG TPA: hypothetical protein GXZ95_01985 [Mollicutes bacterium]|nr:hypothetical protein [Mollicutes bacterium]